MNTLQTNAHIPVRADWFRILRTWCTEIDFKTMGFKKKE